MLRTIPLLFLIAACSGSEPDPPAEPPALPVTSAPQAGPSDSPALALAPVATLAGEWRVAGIDGASVDEPYGLSLSASASEIWWQPRCAGSVRGYAIDGPAITVKLPPDTSSLPVCHSSAPPRQADVARALDAADTIGRTSSNGIEISGGGHSLLLFSQ